MTHVQILYTRRLLLLCWAALLTISRVGLADSTQAILDYATVPTAQNAASVLPPPSSAFHAWKNADVEAQKIVAAWQKEPITIAWTRIQLERYVKHKMMPTRGARGLALVHVAMHDAFHIAEQRRVSARLAVSMAAAEVLAYLFPAEERGFHRIAFSVAARLHETKPESLPPHVNLALAIGQKVGERVIAYAEEDGAQRGWNGVRLQWYGDGRYYGPGTWEPTPPYFYYPPDEPFAPAWRAWTLQTNDEFRPVPPPFGSAKFMQDLTEVVATNAKLTPAQLAIAKFWVDGHGSVTPPGHWNQIAIDYTLAHQFDDARAAELFAQLNIAQADAFIATWEAKYHYWTMRPVSAAKYALGIEFKSAILTPPFPSFPSGHATFSGAAAEVLSVYFPQRAKVLRAMAEEAANSRLLGGIHFRHDNEEGLVLGRRIAAKVLNIYGAKRRLSTSASADFGRMDSTMARSTRARE